MFTNVNCNNDDDDDLPVPGTLYIYVYSFQQPLHRYYNLNEETAQEIAKDTQALRYGGRVQTQL